MNDFFSQSGFPFMLRKFIGGQSKVARKRCFLFFGSCTSNGLKLNKNINIREPDEHMNMTQAVENNPQDTERTLSNKAQITLLMTSNFKAESSAQSRRPHEEMKHYFRTGIEVPKRVSRS